MDATRHLIPDPDLYGLPYWAEDFHDMPYRRLGSSGLRASAIGLGTWKFGYPSTGDGARVDRRTAFAILDRAVDLGVTFWDTANRYNNSSGNSERVIGQWFKANPDQRRNVVLATKVCGSMDGRTPNHCGLSRGNILDSVRASLARLQLDYVDVLYFHNLDPHTPIVESLETVEDLVRQGIVRYLALSNATVDDLDAYAVALSGLSTRARPIAVQNQYDPINRETPRYAGVLDHCAGNGLSYVPYCPLGRGLLTGRYLEGAHTGDRLYDEGILDDIATPDAVERVRNLKALADEWDLELGQLALAYLLSLPGMGPQIPGVSSVAQLESNAAAGRVALLPEQRERIDGVLN